MTEAEGAVKRTRTAAKRTTTTAKNSATKTRRRGEGDRHQRPQDRGCLHDRGRARRQEGRRLTDLLTGSP